MSKQQWSRPSGVEAREQLKEARGGAAELRMLAKAAEKPETAATTGSRPARSAQQSGLGTYSSMTKDNSVLDDTLSVAESTMTDATTASRRSGKGAKGKQKMKPLTHHQSSDGGIVVGAKFECGCFATQHPFLSNCANCGRVFCKQEDDTECYSCGLDTKKCIAVAIKEQEGLIDMAAKKKNAEAYQKALAQRDKLMAFARERTKRTVVVDDQSGQHADTGDKWLSPEERMEAQKAEAKERDRIAQVHQRTGAYTVHLDIVNQNAALGLASCCDENDEAPKGQRLMSAEELEKREVGKDAVMTSMAIPASVGHPSLRGAAQADAQADASPDDQSRGEQDEEEEDYDDEKRMEEIVAMVTGEDADGDDDVFRAEPMPMLAKRIWFNNQKPSSSEAAAADGKTKVKTHKTSAGDRLQTEYYEEDKDVFVRSKVEAMSHARQGPPHDTAANHDVADSYVPPPLNVTPQQEEEARLRMELAKRRKEEREREAAIPDEGMCLSMHQPWASLLVHGIKMHEGRTWSTKHRGVLWIHAAAAKPIGVEEVEAQHAHLVPEGGKFPSYYPTSVLLGCVVVTDCLSQEEYKQKIPKDNQHSGSDHVFMCERPKQLKFLLPMEGRHKIFKLDRKVWIAAKKQLNMK